MSYLIKFILGAIVSFYLFPVSFTFLPESINTKLILAGLGAVCFYLDYPNVSLIKLNKGLLVSTIIAVLFSLICFISIDLNNTDDYSYVTYIVSFLLWIFAAYAVGAAIRSYHGVLNFRTLTLYLLGVCLVQSVLALLIDNSVSFENFVNSIFFQNEHFYQGIDRLYGIGAALDPAGIRFSIVLLMTATLLCEDEKIRSSNTNLTLIILSFLVVGVVGNMISRTTVIGFSSGVMYFILFSGLFKIRILFDSIKLGSVFFLVLVCVIGVSSYLYISNEEFYSNLRFAFEGFFNLVEKGEFRTDSTDKLNNEMWVWPEDLKTWIIGSGIFGNFVYSTDIGYCRFILYSGLTGFITFAFLFVFNAFYFMQKASKYWIMFAIFGILTFVFWLKVATDIFFIYALLYVVDEFVEEKQFTDV